MCVRLVRLVRGMLASFMNKLCIKCITTSAGDCVCSCIYHMHVHHMQVPGTSTFKMLFPHVPSEFITNGEHRYMSTDGDAWQTIDIMKVYCHKHGHKDLASSQVNMVCANRQIPVSAWSALWLRRCQLGRRQVFAPQHAVLCFVWQRRNVFMEISSRSYPRSLYK